MFWLILLLSHTALAGAVPQTTDIVLIYEGANIEDQGKDNYVYTVADDDTIYTCEANRCSLAQFASQAQITMTIYKLPEGYPRVAGVIDQVTLQKYKQAASQTYTVPNVSTAPAGDGSNNRTFQELQLQADGSFSVDTVSQERNSQLLEDRVTDKSWPAYIWYILGGVVVLGLAGGGVWLWKRKF